MAAVFQLVTVILCATLASAQLFPFTSLQEYFDHQARLGSDAELAAESEQVAVAAATQDPPPAARNSTATGQPQPAAPTTDDDDDDEERVQTAEESARVASVLHNPGVPLAPAVVLTPPAVDAPGTDYAAVASQDAAAALLALPPIPTFDSQKNSPAPTKYSSPAVPKFGSLAASPAHTPLAIPTFDSQRSAQPVAPDAYGYPAIPSFLSQGDTQANTFSVYSSPQPAPNPYITIPKLALKAVPFNSYPHPVQTGVPQVHEAFAPPQTLATFKPLKLYKNAPLYPKKYRPELEQPKTTAPTSNTGGLVSKKTHFPKQDYPLVKQQKQNTHNVAATKQAASFQKKALPTAQVPDKSGGKEAAISTKSSTSTVTKLLPSDEQSAAASGFLHSTDSAGEGSGFVNHHDAVAAGLGPGHERVEFQMYGQHGPHTYKFGFDTGKGHNRQFRYEERDPHGHVKGHYGFYNKHGKLQVVSYTADPVHGFHADGNFGKHAV